jgi:1-acyl-sn-glycerol-3-phosphate acyltransferase
VADLVYPPVVLAARAGFAAMGLRFTIEGAHNIPRTGGAVLASNHVSYLDFTFCGLAARPSGRLVRFMAKEAVFTHRISGPLMRGMHHIAVDRDAGTAAFREAVRALKAGEVVGVFPEATISRSFTVKEIKNGAVRMAAATGVPVVPMAVWGSQRIFTKGRPKDFARRGKAITMAVGQPWVPGKREDPGEQTALLSRRLSELLDHLQRTYPQSPSGPDDTWWLPAHLGGTAPTPSEAAALDAAESAARAARRGASGWDDADPAA